MKQLQTQLSGRLCAFLIVLLGCMALSVRADDLIILKGSTAKVNVGEGIRKINVGNPTVIDARPSEDGQSVVVSGVTEGTSELRIEKLQGADLVTNVVVRTDLNETLSQVQDLLSDVEGLTIKIVGNKIVLEGQILTGADFEKVGKVASMFSSSVVNLSTFDRSQMNKYVEQAILKDIGIDTVTARVMGDTVVLDGVVYKAEDMKRAEQLAKLRVPNVVDLIVVQDVMIETDLMFVDMQLSKSLDWGNNVLDSVSVAANLNGERKFTGGWSALYLRRERYGGVENRRGCRERGCQNHCPAAYQHQEREEGDFQDGSTSYFQQPGQVGGPSTLVTCHTASL